MAQLIKLCYIQIHSKKTQKLSQLVIKNLLYKIKTINKIKIETKRKK